MPRTTHSDLAAIIKAHAKRLESIPAGYMVSDAGTQSSLHAAADALIAQDHRIGDFVVALRELLAAVPRDAPAAMAARALLGKS